MLFEKRNNCLIIGLKGEIDHHSSKELRDRIDSELESANVRNIVFDFSEVGFMDSAGVGLLIGRYKTADRLGGKIGITGISSKMDRILDMSGIYKLMKRYATLDDALSELL